MSNDRYQEIRDALAMGPTPGPWYLDGEGVRALVRDANGVIVAVRHRMPGHKNETNMRLIATCDPDTIRELLAERDALAKAAAKYRWGINNARWIRGEQEAYVAIPVAPGTDLSCIAMRDAAISTAMEQEAGRG
jgi:hypothetical protein